MNKSRSPFVIVGMSGGVDSTTTALLLLEQGYRVAGLFMKNWEDDDTDEHCAHAEDYALVADVCKQLDMPVYAMNFAQEYRDNVFAHFLNEYKNGRTPNPDILCNREIKFKTFLNYAEELGADYIATGHYARIKKDGDYKLLTSLDQNKDQTYFLYTLNQNALAKTLFPIGHLQKPEVRALAKKAGLPNHDRKDSTGICFIGERKFKDFMMQYLPAKPGAIRTPEGKEVGRHDGLMYYTIGQRQGLNIGGPGEPWYVTKKEIETNTLYAVQGHDHPALYHHGLIADEVHWINDNAQFPLRCQAKIRYRQPHQACTITPVNNNQLKVEFDEAQWAVSPGQSVVFYNHEQCLGGGIIQKATVSQSAP